MKKAVGIIYLFLVQILFVQVSLAQQLPADSLAQRFQQLNLTDPEDVLYVATDKDIYLPGETIWFAGYLLEGVQKEEALQADLLGVALLREDSTAVSLRKNYLLEQGLCPGSLTLPENLTAGRYLLLATTNLSKKDGEPLHRFYRPLTIMSTTTPEISVDFEIVEDDTKKDSLYIEVYAMLPEDISNGGLRRSRVTYNLPGQQETDVDLDKNGRARITLAKSVVRDSTPVLFTTTRIDRQEKTFNIRLPVDRDLNNRDRDNGERDSIFQIHRAVANNTLKIGFKSDAKESLQMAVTHLHSRKTEITPAFKPKKGMKMELPLKGIGKGINQLSLFDLNGEPITSKLFFAHYDQKNTVELQLNQEQFTVRDSVSTTLRIRDSQGNPLGGIFTVSCVQADRLEPEQNLDLESYYYTHPLQNNYNGTGDDPLGAYGKPKALGTKLTNGNAGLLTPYPLDRDGSLAVRKSALVGTIRKLDGKPLTGSIQVLLGRDSIMEMIPVPVEGSFVPDPISVTTPEGAYFWMQVMRDGENYMEYIQLEAVDPFEKFIPLLTGEQYPVSNSAAKVKNGKMFILPPDMGDRYTLETVFLKEAKERWGNRTNGCADYVCDVGYLNCSIHHPFTVGTVLPKKGERYKIEVGKGFVYTIYEDCIYQGNRLQVYTSKEFIGMDKEKRDNDYADFYISTLYWEAFKTAISDKETQINFYTSDLTGTFKLRIEGIATNGDFIKAEKTFRVSK